MTAQISVQQADFVAGLKRLGKTTHLTVTKELTLSFADGSLTIAVMGARVSIPATGAWIGTATLPLLALKAMKRIPKREAELTLRVDGDMLHVEGPELRVSYECAWSNSQPERSPLPLNAPVLQILAAGEVHTEEQLRQSGLASAVAVAAQRRDVAIERAVRHLGEFEVTAADLQKLIARKVQKHRRQ